ncbi:unnamed protein product [Cylicocyclus nassatus]|uniref:Uncharacterized protein n=1 Tax=Cylicocyclus nassatus TaxID=53992 RepID=A0AA36M843_CYLNA|nr:unnamed protein product [Cylicocyclus nassatus]
MSSTQNTPKRTRTQTDPTTKAGSFEGFFQNITLNSVFINTDAVLKLSSYGDVAQNASEEKFREDITSVGSILARLLLEEGSFLKLLKIKSHNELEWRTIMQGNVESGLVDFHARNMLYLLLGSSCSLSDLLRHPYMLTFRKNAVKCRLSKQSIRISQHSVSTTFTIVAR